MRILVAEDDSSLRRALISILQKNHYTAEAVDNGDDALDYLLSGLYDAAILDIMMPVMDGVSVLVEVRKAHNATYIAAHRQGGNRRQNHWAGCRSQRLSDQAL